MKRYLFLFALMVTLGVQAQTSTKFSHAEAAWIHFLDPVNAIENGQRINGKVLLADALKADVQRGQLIETIADEISRQLGKYPNQTVSNIDVTFYDTPSGNMRKSSRSGSRSSRSSSRGTTRSGKNMQGLREILMERLGADNVTVTIVPEDWESIIRVTQEQPDIRLKLAALDIMQHVGVQNGREQQLKALAGGETWQQLQQQVFPQVQRIEYKAVLSQPVSVTADGVGVTLEGLYVTARSHQKGSNDYYDIIDLAARLFPESAEAAINAAGVAMLRGDVKKASACLRPWQADSRACLHQGVLHMLRGDRVKAEVQLRLALAQGVPEAAAALSALLAGEE